MLAVCLKFVAVDYVVYVKDKSKVFTLFLRKRLRIFHIQRILWIAVHYNTASERLAIAFIILSDN